MKENIQQAFTKSLASEQSLEITFAALVPWFQIPDPNPDSNPNQYPESYHNPNPIPNLNPIEKWSLFSRLAEHWSLPYDMRGDSESASKYTIYVEPYLQVQISKNARL